ncbi:MAG: hypothetical protein QOD63_3074, partial [Actinomycetota bacterium]|nr:hypothetical protein [Actinomycetota bacterium]
MTPRSRLRPGRLARELAVLRVHLVLARDGVGDAYPPEAARVPGIEARISTL